jgi:hypothetical protein
MEGVITATSGRKPMRKYLHLLGIVRVGFASLNDLDAHVVEVVKVV